MEKYSKAVSEMYSQFKKREAHPLEKYIGRLVKYNGRESKVVGYSYQKWLGEYVLIVEASEEIGWTDLDPSDVIFKDCKYYWYVRINDLIDYD